MKVLIVEDDKNFGFVLREELDTYGFDAELATDGVEGVLKFIGGGFGFVLLDLKMPRLDGIDALRIMKKLNPATPAIAYSGNAGSAEMADALNAGALRCVTKPFGIAQLAEEIRKHGPEQGGMP